MTTILTSWLTESVVGLARTATDAPAVRPVLADALEDAGCADASLLAYLRSGSWLDDGAEVVRLLAAGDAAAVATRTETARVAAFRRSCLAGCGVTGNRWTLADLGRRITRARPRGAGSRANLAARLAARLDELAGRRWARACRGQRRPTPRQAADLVRRVADDLAAVQTRQRERLMTAAEVLAVARAADRDGAASDNGGTVAAASYRYRWTTTGALATRQPDGTIAVTLSRAGTRTVVAPARHWRDVTAAADVLRGGGAVGLRRGDGWEVLDADGGRVGVAVPMPADLAGRFGRWEHGADAAACAREIEHKRGVYAEERAHAAKAEADRREEIRQAQRQDRAARLLARIGARTPVTYADARACGMCDAGIRAFAARVGVADLTAAVPLAEVARLEPGHAVRLARLVLSRRRAEPVAG